MMMARSTFPLFLALCLAAISTVGGFDFFGARVLRARALFANRPRGFRAVGPLFERSKRSAQSKASTAKVANATAKRKEPSTTARSVANTPMPQDGNFSADTFADRTSAAAAAALASYFLAGSIADELNLPATVAGATAGWIVSGQETLAGDLTRFAGNLLSSAFGKAYDADKRYGYVKGAMGLSTKTIGAIGKSITENSDLKTALSATAERLSSAQVRYLMTKSTAEENMRAFNDSLTATDESIAELNTVLNDAKFKFLFGAGRTERLSATTSSLASELQETRASLAKLQAQAQTQEDEIAARCVKLEALVEDLKVRDSQAQENEKELSRAMARVEDLVASCAKLEESAKEREGAFKAEMEAKDAALLEQQQLVVEQTNLREAMEKELALKTDAAAAAEKELALKAEAADAAEAAARDAALRVEELEAQVQLISEERDALLAAPASQSAADAIGGGRALLEALSGGLEGFGEELLAEEEPEEEGLGNLNFRSESGGEMDSIAEQLGFDVEEAGMMSIQEGEADAMGAGAFGGDAAFDEDEDTEIERAMSELGAMFSASADGADGLPSLAELEMDLEGLALAEDFGEEETMVAAAAVEAAAPAPGDVEAMREEYSAMTVKALKDVCRELGLTVGGKKADIVDRIVAFKSGD